MKLAGDWGRERYGFIWSPVGRFSYLSPEKCASRRTYTLGPNIHSEKRDTTKQLPVDR